MVATNAKKGKLKVELIDSAKKVVPLSCVLCEVDCGGVFVLAIFSGISNYQFCVSLLSLRNE